MPIAFKGGTFALPGVSPGALLQSVAASDRPKTRPDYADPAAAEATAARL